MIDPNSGAVLILRRTKPWVRLASVVVILLAGLALMLGLDAAGSAGSRRLEIAPILLLDFGFGLICLVSATYLHKFAQRISVFVAQGHNVQLEAALEAQRRFWKYTVCGILVLALLLILAAGFVMM